MLYDAFKVDHKGNTPFYIGHKTITEWYQFLTYVSQKLVPFCNCFMTNVKWGVSFDEISV